MPAFAADVVASPPTIFTPIDMMSPPSRVNSRRSNGGDVGHAYGSHNSSGTRDGESTSGGGCHAEGHLSGAGGSSNSHSDGCGTGGHSGSGGGSRGRSGGGAGTGDGHPNRRRHQRNRRRFRPYNESVST